MDEFKDVTVKRGVREKLSSLVNPRYVTYASKHNRTHEEMLLFDTERYPGGKMAGFTIWIQERWRMWRVLRDYDSRRVLTPEDHANFDAWLELQVSDG